MNVTRVVSELQRKYPGKQIFENKDVNGVTTEIVCELEKHTDYSKAVAIIDRSAQHYHKVITEEYSVISGKLELFVDQVNIELSAGARYTISPNKLHYAVGNETWVEVIARPQWEPNDHILSV